MSNTNTSNALVQTEARAIRVSGTFRDPEEVTARLQHAAKHYHLVSPATACGMIPEGCSITLSTVLVDVENETYDVGGKRGLSKSALDRIAAAAGISWDARLSGRLDDASDPHYVLWRVVGTMRHLDGTIVQLLGTKEMDLREGSAQVEALYDRYKAKYDSWVRGGRKGYEPKSPDGQIREMRLHIVAHAESKARLRAIRSLGVRSAYDAKELTKPFVVAKMAWTGQSDDPEIRRAFALKQADAMLSGHRALYGDAPAAPLPPASGIPQLGARQPPPIGQSAEPSAPDAFDVPEPPPSEPEPKAQPAKRSSASNGESKPAREPTSVQEPAPAPADGPVCRFGTQKGRPLSSLSDEDLDWYHGAVKSSVDDPAKARFRAANEAHLKEVLAELERRNGVTPADPQGDEVDRGDDADAY